MQEPDREPVVFIIIIVIITVIVINIIFINNTFINIIFISMIVSEAPRKLTQVLFGHC